MSKDIVVVSNNKGKINEFKKILKNFNVLSLDDLNIDVDIKEDGITFKDNAIKKVMALGNSYKYVIADDSGLEILALDNKPGVYSARFLGEDTPYSEKNQKVIKMLEDKDDLSARFVSVIAFKHNDEFKTFMGIIEGEISKSIKGDKGFGYDPIFYVREYDQTFGEMSEQIKNKISHRAIALNKFMEYLKDEEIID